MAVRPEDLEDGEVLELEDERQEVEDTDDGGAVVKIGEDESVDETGFYDNIVDLFEQSALESLATELMRDVERDKKTREDRDKEYAKSIKRTGLGDEAPGGADFEGASDVTFPMLTEASVDFSARAIKELMPSNGPVRVYIPSEKIDQKRIEKAERKKNYMNWQFIVQMPEFRAELEQLLPQIALAGSQFLRIVADHSRRRKRPVPQYIPSDRCYMPFAASSWYTAERQTFAEPITKLEFEARVRDGMYREIGDLPTPAMPEQTAPEKATNKVEGKSSTEFYNEDGLRTVYEISTWRSFDEDDLASDEEDFGAPAPYLISLDEASRKIVSIVRNWEEDDEERDRMQWIIEFPFIPWRGAGSIGLGQMVGSLAGGATGALRALLDSAHVNNFPTAVKLKGANLIGQTQRLGIGQLAEIEGGVDGTDIRKLIMNLPFNPPSDTLFRLLGFCVDAGRGVVRTTFENLTGDTNNPNMPVGTTLALIEEGQKVLSAIHLRLYHAMTYVIRVVHRIDRMYLTDDEVKDDTGEIIARASDFDDPLDCVPTADPEIFSDVQRLAQLQIVEQMADKHPELFNQRAVYKRMLERTKIPNPEELLIPEVKPEWMNAANENSAMSLGRPVTAFPEQDQLGHIQTHLDFLMSPVLGQLSIIAKTFVPAVLEHLKEHIVLWYVAEYYEMLKMALEMDDEEVANVMREHDPETRAELDRLIAEASPDVVRRANEMFGENIPSVVTQAMELVKQYQQPPQIPVDPNKMAQVEAQKETAQLREKGQTERLIMQLEKEDSRTMQELSADQRREAVRMADEEAREAAERAARLRELMVRESGQTKRAADQLSVTERVNMQDNLTALRISAAELEAGDDVSLSTGKGINPSGDRG
jgi:hypothetical protein